MPEEYPLCEACRNIRDKIKGKERPVNPYRALYPLRIVALLLPYELQTIRKFAYGTIPGSPLVFFRDKKRNYCVARTELVRYFNDLEQVNTCSQM